MDCIAIMTTHKWFWKKGWALKKLNKIKGDIYKLIWITLAISLSLPSLK